MCVCASELGQVDRRMLDYLVGLDTELEEMVEGALWEANRSLPDYVAGGGCSTLYHTADPQPHHVLTQARTVQVAPATRPT